MHCYTTLCNVFAQKSSCPELNEVNSHTKLCHSNHLLKNIHPVMLASFCSLTKIYLEWPHRHAYPSTKKKHVPTKRLHTQLTFSHWWCQSASHKWLILHQWPVWYLLISESRLVSIYRPGLLIISWCCYNSSCLYSVKSQASSLSFSRTVPGALGVWGNQLFHYNFVNSWAISKILSKLTQQ